MNSFRVPLCSFLCIIFAYVWLVVLSRPDEDITQHYTFGVIAVAGSCIIEMCSEPLYLVSKAFLFVKLRVRMCSWVRYRILFSNSHSVFKFSFINFFQVFADIVQMFVRTVTFVLLILKSAEHAVLAFSIAQVLSVFSYVVFLYVYFYFYVRAKNQIQDDNGIKKEDKTVVNFPFRSMTDFLPKILRNTVSRKK